MYNRMPPEIKMIVKKAGAGMPRDDEIHIVSRPVSIKYTLFLINMTTELPIRISMGRPASLWNYRA